MKFERFSAVEDRVYYFEKNISNPNGIRKYTELRNIARIDFASAVGVEDHFDAAEAGRGDASLKLPIAQEKVNGGIDLNAKKMDLEVAKDGKGVAMTFDPAMVAEFKRGDFTGVEGVILNIVTITNPLTLFGLSVNSEASPAVTG
ncbi:MAG: hypothetical protein WCI27_07130 [Candidatus Omnitrophota bacterium]